MKAKIYCIGVGPGDPELITVKAIRIIEEADIIAYKEGLVVFVEVKTRSSTLYGEPQDFVDYNKRRSYVKMANAYIQARRRSEEVRFDIIAVEVGTTGYRLNHIENAFNAIEVWNNRSGRRFWK